MRLLPTVIQSHAREREEMPAYLFHGSAGQILALSYGSLVSRAAAVAGELLAVGCRPGDPVALICGHGPAFISGLLGTFLAGCAAVPIAPPEGRTRQSRAAAILAEAECAIALTGGELPLLQAAERGELLAGRTVVRIDAAAATDRLDPVVPRPGDVAIVQYTSGSTGAPRGVIVTHAALEAQQRAIERAVQPQVEERAVTWLPQEHDMGLIGGLLFNLWRGGTSYVLPPAGFIRRPALWLETISRWRGTISVAPNFAYDLCVRAIPANRRDGLDLSTWRVALNGAEPIRTETLARFADAFGPLGFNPQAFLPCYGLAEAALLVSGANRGQGATTAWFEATALERGQVVPAPAGEGRHLVSSGPVRTSGGVQITDADTGLPCAPDRIGEIWIAGDSLGSGYHNQPKASRSTFQARTADGEGPWLRSGDLGFLWGNELYVTGRIRDTILVNGRTLHAADIECAVDGCDSHVRAGRIAAHQDGCGELALALEVASPLTHETQTGLASDLALRIWQRLLAETGVQATRVMLVRPGTLLWTTSGKLRRAASHARIGSNPESLLLDWRPQQSVARQAQLSALETLALAHGPGGAPAEAYVTFFMAWIAAATACETDLIDPSLPWTDQGLDSLMVMALVLDLEQAMGRTIAAEQLFEQSDPISLAASLACRSR